MEHDMIERVTAMIGMNPLLELDEYGVMAKRSAELKRREGEILSRLAHYRGFFNGMSSHYEHERKQVLAEIKQAQREAFRVARAKHTEAQLDDYANAHPTYVEWLKAKGRERIEMHQLEAELAMTHADMEEAKANVKQAEQRVRLVEELIRMSRSEMALTR